MKAMDESFKNACQGRDVGGKVRAWHDIGWNNGVAYAHSPQQAADMAELVKERDALEQTLQNQPPLDETVQIGQSCRVYSVEYVDKLKLDSEVACADVHAMREEVQKLEARLSRVYDERNALVITVANLALAAGYKAGWGMDSNEQSDPEWRTVVYVQFPGVTYTDTWQGGQLVVPNFQLSWHMAPGWQTAAQANLPQFDGQWDGSFLGREPANYVGQVPSVPHMSQITSVTLDCDQMSAAQVIALAPCFENSPTGRIVERADTGEHIADVWHEGSKSFYRATLHEKLTPEQVQAEPPEVAMASQNVEPDKTQKAAARLKTLIDLCGHVQNGSDTTVKLFQDDATGACFVRTGDDIPAKRSWWGASFGEAIDNAEKDRAKWEQS